MAAITLAPLLLLLVFLAVPAHSWRPKPNNTKPNSADSLYGGSKKYEGSSKLVKLKYHMGPVLSLNVTVHPIWYGNWAENKKSIIRDFIRSISDTKSKPPSVAAWWKTVRLYTNKTGAHVTGSVTLGADINDSTYSHGKNLTRLSVPKVIKSALPGAIDAPGNVYLLLTSDDVYVQDFCSSACGFHNHYPFGLHALPYAWVGNSAKMCPEMCAYPFAVPSYMNGSVKPVKAPNGVVGVDGMITVIAHELAEMATNPFSDAWFAGHADFPVEIGDLCESIFGTGGGGSYMGNLTTDKDGATYNLNGAVGRRFLVQWLWSKELNYCTGPNALDHN
ncbi:hypothetical protein CASFOL_006844 [Castilleja foliolosa]|uniref:Protein EXORDIUM-like 3 n=1 Tax=Castilleja foliolosa TaxID=1961234 RepID=A0ABD3EBF0_9LAMI